MVPLNVSGRPQDVDTPEKKTRRSRPLPGCRPRAEDVAASARFGELSEALTGVRFP